MQKPNEKKGITWTGLCFVITFIFITLKACGAVDWAWWVVFLPAIIIGACWTVVGICVLIYAIIATEGQRRRDKRK